jgi:hypothetical protein
MLTIPPKGSSAGKENAMAELRLCCTRAEFTTPFMKEVGSFQCLEAIERAIDDFAENEMGHREFFWQKPHKAG